MIFKNNNKATFTLGFVSLAFFISYPFHTNFWGGLVASGFEAALVGGLADWFAVTALFRKPLGIPFHTAIIPRNREKIVNVLVEVVESEILIKDNIKKRLENYDSSNQLIQLLLSHNGRSIIKKAIYGFAYDVLNPENAEEVGEVVNTILRENPVRIKIVPYLITALELGKERGYAEKIIDFMLEELLLWVETKSFKQQLASWLSEVAIHYEQEMSRRKLFNQLNDLSNTKVAKIVQQALCSWLITIKDPQHSLRQRTEAWFAEYFLRVKSNEILKGRIEDWLQRTAIGNIKVSQYIIRELMQGLEKVMLDTRRSVNYLDKMLTIIERVLQDFAQNTAEKEIINQALNQVIYDWIDQHHCEIGRIVKTNLNQLSNDLLVQFIETKVGNDLQMIRINGSVVGGIAGVLLYLMNSWI